MNLEESTLLFLLLGRVSDEKASKIAGTTVDVKVLRSKLPTKMQSPIEPFGVHLHGE